MTPASRLIHEGVVPELADEMALALRSVGNLESEDARFAAYYRANVDLLSFHFKAQLAADQVARSIELARRLK